MSSCVTRGYPLGAADQVDILLSETGPLYAATLDANGNPSLQRQRPFETTVTLNMIDDGDPAFGGYVDVRIQPAEALDISSQIGESGGPTCQIENDNFRCTASRDGVAQFIASSQSAWSGDAQIIVSWAATTKTQVITVAPAGLPTADKAPNFELVIGGVPGTTGDVTTQHIPATFIELACTVDAKPGAPGNAWPDGRVRARQAHARVTRPTATPEVVENAPVLIEALDSEAAISTDPLCGTANRTARLATTMDGTGQTEDFYLCFSDIGGPVRFAVSSGLQSFERDLTVDAEPYLLRVKTEPHAIAQSLTPQSIFTIDAFDINALPLKMSVDLAILDDSVLQLQPTATTIQTAGPLDTASTVVEVFAVKTGRTQLKATPLLLSTPYCLSDFVTVTPATE